MSEQRFPIAVVMERVALDNRWVSEKWQPAAVIPGAERATPAVEELENGPECGRWVYRGLELELHRSEGEGYHLNITSPEPRVFVLWRFEGQRAVPHLVTVSYNEAARWLDGGEQVDSVTMPAEIMAWMTPWVVAHYRPEPRKKVRRNDPFREGAFRREPR